VPIYFDHSWMEDKVIMIPFPRDICSRDIISYFCSTHDEGFFKIVDSLSSVPWTIYKNTHKNDRMDCTCKG